MKPPRGGTRTVKLLMAQAINSALPYAVGWLEAGKERRDMCRTAAERAFGVVIVTYDIKPKKGKRR